jgi:hypothetical protein
VVDLAAGADAGLLDLDEVADVGTRLQHRLRAQAGEGPDPGAGADLRPSMTQLAKISAPSPMVQSRSRQFGPMRTPSPR